MNTSLEIININHEIEFTDDYLSQAFEDLNTLNTVTTILNKPVVCAETIKISNIITSSIYTRQLGIKLAIEDNTNNKVGIIRKIINAIKAAVKWIINKIKQFWNWITGNTSSAKANEFRLKHAPDIKFNIKNNIVTVSELDKIKKRSAETNAWIIKHAKQSEESRLEREKIIDDIQNLVTKRKSSTISIKELTEELDKISDNISSDYKISNSEKENIVNTIIKEPKEILNSQTLLALTYNPSKIEIPLDKLELNDKFLYAVAVLCYGSIKHDSRISLSQKNIETALKQIENIQEVLSDLLANIMQIIKNQTLEKFITNIGIFATDINNEITKEKENIEINNELVSNYLKQYEQNIMDNLDILFSIGNVDTDYVSKAKYPSGPYSELYRILSAESLDVDENNLIYTGVQHLLYLPTQQFKKEAVDHDYINNSIRKRVSYLKSVFTNPLIIDSDKDRIIHSMIYDFDDTTTDIIRKQYKYYNDRKANINYIGKDCSELIEKILNNLNNLSEKIEKEIVSINNFTQEAGEIKQKLLSHGLTVITALIKYVSSINIVNTQMTALVNLEFENYFTKLTKAIL